MVDTHDPAGWYPDPTGNHELRYWDGYAWLDNVSDQGVVATDPLGGKPMPPPSQVAARQAEQQTAPPSSRSNTPIIVAAVVVAVLVIAAAVFLLTRDGGSDTTALKTEAVLFSDAGKDATRPTVHRVKVASNSAVLIKVAADDPAVTPAIIVEADQKVVNSVNSKLSGASDVLGNKLKDACTNLREEDIGAKGSVAYFFASAPGVGRTLQDFTIIPVAGEFEFVPVVIDKNGDCKGGKLTMTLTPRPLSLDNVSNLSDLDSVVSDNSELSSILSGLSS